MGVRGRPLTDDEDKLFTGLRDSPTPGPTISQKITRVGKPCSYCREMFVHQHLLNVRNSRISQSRRTPT